MVSSYTLGGGIHLLLAIAVVVIIFQLISGRKWLNLHKPFRSKQENEMKKYLLFMLVVLSLSASLTGCNAVHGAGQDISDTGHNISHAA